MKVEYAHEVGIYFHQVNRVVKGMICVSLLSCSLPGLECCQELDRVRDAIEFKFELAIYLYP